MNAKDYLMAQAENKINEQLKNSVVVWMNGNIEFILKRDTDKKLINKAIELMNTNKNKIELEYY